MRESQQPSEDQEDGKFEWVKIQKGAGEGRVQVLFDENGHENDGGGDGGGGGGGGDGGGGMNDGCNIYPMRDQITAMLLRLLWHTLQHIENIGRKW